MQLKTFVVLDIIIIFCNIYYFVIVSALVGVHVQTAEENEFPFTVCLVELDDNVTIEENAFCTGSLLTNSHILTSEHCLDDAENKAFRIYFGSINLRLATPHIPLIWISFDQWATSIGKAIDYPENDISIIKLLKKLPDGTPTVQLSPITDNELLYGKDAITAGWGIKNNNILPTNLQKANVKIITNEQCAYIISTLQGEESPVPEELYLCSHNNPYVHFGSGDSGGPLIHQNYLIAINKALCPDIDFNKHQVNAYLGINFYREYITINTCI